MHVKPFVVVDEEKRYDWKVRSVVDYAIEGGEGQEGVVVVCRCFVFLWDVPSVVVHVRRGRRCMWRMRMRLWILYRRREIMPRYG